MIETASATAADTEVTATLLARRTHGNLSAITDSERRSLRPIGATAGEVAKKTGDLLTELFVLPEVRIFQGISPAAPEAPRIPHAISAGHQLVLIESVAWPPGRYAATSAGQIHCDGVYIGQSVGPLIAAVRHWRKLLPRDYRVSAMVIVHWNADGDLVLPAATVRYLAWTRADQAVRNIQARLASEQRPASIKTVAALAAATVVEENR